MASQAKQNRTSDSIYLKLLYFLIKIKANGSISAGGDAKVITLAACVP
jgi:hypothetical protein